MSMDVTFYGLELAAAPGAVFTPRPTSELLVDAALARLGDAPARVADVGTGSGRARDRRSPCSGPRSRSSPPTSAGRPSALARENAARHGVSDRVRVLTADLLDGVEGPFDLVVANLPYLPPGREADFPGEPPAAVVSTSDGLDHYRRLAAQAALVLAPGGVLLVQLHGEVRELTPEALAA